MPLFDKQVPKNLLDVQKWFGAVITAPLEKGDLISPTAPSGNSIKEEALAFIVPSEGLEPFERIQIYNQQYWWRLLTILQDAFPCVVRLFGFHDFNQLIAVPYLAKYPADDWSLNSLGSRLTFWIEEFYHAEDKSLVLDAARLDYAYQVLFFTSSFPPLNVTNEDFSVKPLYMQPSSLLIDFPYDMVEFRKALLKCEPEYWLENPFPDLKKEPTFVLIYRNLSGRFKTKALSETESKLLAHFREGISIDTLCEWVEKQPESFRKDTEKHLQSWFQEWTVMGILYQ